MFRRCAGAFQAGNPGGEVIHDMAADEVAGDHEKHIDPGKSAGQEAEPGVMEDNAENGDGAQPVDVFAVGRGHRSPVSPFAGAFCMSGAFAARRRERALAVGGGLWFPPRTRISDEAV